MKDFYKQKLKLISGKRNKKDPYTKLLASLDLLAEEMLSQPSSSEAMT